MGDFLGILQEFKKHHRRIVSQACKWHRYIGDGVWFFLIIVTQLQLLRTSLVQIVFSQVD